MSSLWNVTTELTPGGLILWSRSFTPAFTELAASVNSPVNSLIREALIEGKARGEDETFERDGYSVKWTMENGLGLVFVVSRRTSCTSMGRTLTS